MDFHLDTDFLVKALSESGPQRQRLLTLSRSRARLQMSSMAWYEFSRGPRTPEQLAVARSFLLKDGILALTEEIATRAAEQFRVLGSPRRRAADILIGVTAVVFGCTLLTNNERDFAGIEGLSLEAVES